MLRILVLQTCDGSVYAPLLDYSQPKHEAYCRKHGYEYMRWDGIKKGQENYPGFAVFNKIYLLKEILKTGAYDWVVYLDAATIILDLERPVEDFLHLNKVMIGCSEDKNTCDISFSLYNMNHPKLSILLDDWQQSFETNLGKDKTNQFKNGWPNFKSYNDQLLLNEILKKKQSYAFLYDSNYFIYDTQFIGNIKRLRNMTVETRLELLKEMDKSGFYKSTKNTLDSPPLPVPQQEQPPAMNVVSDQQ